MKKILSLLVFFICISAFAIPQDTFNKKKKNKTPKPKVNQVVF